jgi:hypothetical protein
MPQPATPPAPLITYNAFELHSDAPSGNQWYDQNGIIPGATEPDYTALEAGQYYVIVTLNGCSSSPSNIVELFNESVGVGPSLALIKIFPNPMKEELMIEVMGNMKTLNYEILNSLGESLVAGSFVHQALVNTNSFPSGLYMVKVSMGQEVIMKKVVKD